MFQEVLCYYMTMATHSLKDRYRVYIDAMIPSYLVAPLSRDPKIAEWQRITREFWQDPRFEFVLSDYVIDEISIGDRKQVANRLQAVASVPVIVVRHSDLTFAEQLIHQRALPQGAFTDAVHIAIAASRAIPYLATWNFAHLANRNVRSKVEQICQMRVIRLPALTRQRRYWRKPMCDDPGKDILEAKERLVALFGDLETYVEFMMKRQEKRIKQGVKYIDLPIVRVKTPETSEVQEQ